MFLLNSASMKEARREGMAEKETPQPLGRFSRTNPLAF